jgi:hypothetical protein
VALSTKLQEARDAIRGYMPVMMVGADWDAFEAEIRHVFEVSYWTAGQNLDKLRDCGVCRLEVEELCEKVEIACTGLCLRCAKGGVWDLSILCKIAEHKSQ